MRLTWTPVRPGPGDNRRSWRCRGRREAVLLRGAGRTDSVLHDPKPFAPDATRRLRGNLRFGLTGPWRGRVPRVVAQCRLPPPGRWEAGDRLATTGALLGRVESLVWALFFLWVALAVDPTIESQFTLPKLFGFYAGIPVLAVIWLSRLWTGRLRMPPRHILVLAGALAAWWALSLAAAVHLPTALFGMHGRYNGLWMHLALLALFVMRSTAALSPDETRLELRILVFTLLPVAAFTIVQCVGLQASYPADRPPATIGHPVILAATLALCVPW